MQSSVIVGIALIIAGTIRTRGKNLSATPLDKAFLFWLAAIGLSLFLSELGPSSFQESTSFWTITAYYVTWYFLDSERMLYKALIGIILLSCVVSAFGVFQSISGTYPLGHLLHPDIEVLLKPITGAEGKVGAVGLFFSRLTFAHVLLFPFCWSLALAIEQATFRNRLLWLAAALCIEVGIFVTWTRAALVVSILAALAIASTTLFHRKGARIALVASILLLGTIGSILTQQVTNRLIESFSGSRDWGRLTLWQIAEDEANRYPLTGIGYGNYRNGAEKDIAVRTHAVGAEQFPGVLAWGHSNLLTVLAETGAIGTIGFCLLFVVFFRRAWRIRKDLPPDKVFLRGFVRGSIVAVASFLAIGLFHDNLFDGEVVYNLWFTVGATLAIGRWTLENKTYR